MGLRYLYFVSTLMLVLVTCSAQTTTEAPSEITSPNATTPDVTQAPTTASNMTTAMEPDTDTANSSTTANPNTKAPEPDIPTTEAPGTKAPTTQAPRTDSPTESPAAGTTEKAPDSGSSKGFSAGSFVGGIILAVAVLGIGFCGFKFFQSRQDKNYQTL